MATLSRHDNLFVQQTSLAPQPSATGLLTLRDYQAEDADTVCRLWSEGYRSPVLRLATGGGKSVVIAELARRMAKSGRVLITVDVTGLAEDLAQTIYEHTGKSPGLLIGPLKEGLDRPILVATIQSLYAGETGSEAFRLYDPGEFSAMLVDECESSVAPRYSDVVQYFLSNPDLKLMGASATPFRGDGQGMSKHYDYAEDEAGPLNRDILWCRDNGWLVNLKQGFVHTNVDFSKLSVRRDEHGDKDYSDTELAKLIEEEADLRQMAHGIVDAANGEPAIVICPQSVDLCDKLAAHLDAVDPGCAMSVHGDKDNPGERIQQFKRGDYQIIVSVKKLEKGFDSDRVRHCFACRKTKSRRLYEQWAGRAVRPLTEIRPALAEAETAEERRQIIAESGKPHATMWDLVGVNEDAKDLLGVVDILNGSASERVKGRAKQKTLEGEYDTDEAAEEAAREIEDEDKREKERQREEEERRKRRLVQTTAESETEVTDDLRAKGGAFMRSDASARHLEILHRGGWPEKVVAKMTAKEVKDNAKKQVARWRMGLCSYKQAMFLIRRGHDRNQVRAMKKSDASQLIEGYKNN